MSKNIVIPNSAKEESILPDTIETLKESSFEGLEVDKLVIQKGVKQIPIDCFNNAKIKELKFDRVLFDNMDTKTLRAGVKIAKNLYETEASGGVTLKNIKKIAATGVNRISIGQLTHSISAIDLKLEV